MSPPDVAVIIPVHDRTDYLDAALASVRAQRGVGTVDVLVIDDGSTLPVARHPAVRRHGARVIRQDHAGVNQARQTGAESTAARLLAYLDDDDVWPEDYLRSQVAFLEANPDAGMVWSDVVHLHPGREPGPTGWYGRFGDLRTPSRRAAQGGEGGWIYPRGALLRQALLREPAYPSALVVRAGFLAAIGGWNPGALPYLDCFDVFYRATRHGTVGFNPGRLVRIRRGHAQSTADLEQARLQQSRSFARWVRHDPTVTMRCRALLGWRLLKLARSAMRHGRPGAAAIQLGCAAQAALLPRRGAGT